MAKPKEITSGDGSSGVSVTYIKSRGQIWVNGWYDTFGGIQGIDMPLSEFFKQLGITEADCKKAYKGWVE